MAVDNVTPLDTTTFSDILKLFYLGPIRDNLNSKTIALKRFTRKTIGGSGLSFEIPVRIGRNEGVGSIGQNGALPDPGRQRFDRVSITMKRHYARILFNGAVVAASRNADGAFAEAVDVEVEGVTEDIKNEWNRQIFGDGSGRLAQINGAPVGATYTLDNPGGFGNPGPGVQYMRPGMIVGVFNEITGAFRGSAEITALDATLQTITLSAAILGALNNEYFYRVSENTSGVVGSLRAGSWGAFNEIVGLAGAINNADLPAAAGGTSAYETILSAVNVWNSVVIGNGGIAIPLDLDMLQQMEDAVNQAGDGRPSIRLGSFGVLRSYLALLVNDKRYVNTLELDGGWTSLEYNQKPILPDKDATWGRLYAIDEAVWAIYQHSPIRWIDEDGSVIRRMENTHAFQAALMAFWELGCTQRNRNGVLVDLQDPL